MALVSTPDAMGFLDELAKFREVISGMVAGFVADGFSEEQARRLVVKIMTADPVTPGDDNCHEPGVCCLTCETHAEPHFACWVES